jgi:HAD superfamily hydrolase (TIGR01549 family)|tara:strand:+ start:1522 stop:2175 length:654 start_codon:yes stop_codon:yes gene_type:complete
MIKAIIFDFDGVIVESVNIKSTAFSEMYKAHGRDVVEKVLAHHLLNGGISRFEKFRFYHKQYLGVSLTKSELAKIANQFSNLVVDKVISAPYVPGAYEFLSEYNNIYDFYISTGTPDAEIIRILKAKQIEVFFKGVYGSPEKKSEHVRRILSNGEYQKNEVIFVGDSVTDREAARNNNIPFIARVAGGNGKLETEKLTISNLENFSELIRNNIFPLL